MFFQLTILRPHPHFTRHVRKKNLQNHLHFTFENLQVRRSAFYRRPTLSGRTTDLYSAVFRQKAADRRRPVHFEERQILSVTKDTKSQHFCRQIKSYYISLNFQAMTRFT